ncbi:MAG: glycosyltransferase [Flavobacteriaceae bacterium]
MKNICFFINTLAAAGGTQRVLTSLVNLIVNNYNVTIIILDSKAPFFDIDSKANIKTIRPKKSIKILSLIKLNILIYQELKLNSCDYYISLDSNSVLMQSLLLPIKTKLIVWEHFSLSKNYNKKLYRVSRYYASKRAYKFVLLSKEEVRSWQNKYNIPSNKLAQIYNPITIEENIDSLEVDLYKNKKILAIGNNIYIKGFDYLIESWSLIEKNDWTLEIVGLPEKEQEKLKNLIKKFKIENEVIINGRISNIKEKYLESSIYCLCSRMEATPLVLIESQHLGLPAIVFDNCEGPLELLDDSGLIVNFEDVIQYKDAISKLMNSKPMYEKMSINAKKNSQRFNNDTFYRKWCEILN